MAIIGVNNKISILGCGWFGLPLAKLLNQCGWHVKGSTTTHSKINLLNQAEIEPFLIDLDDNEKPIDVGFFNADVLLINVPPSRKSQQHNYLQKMQKLLAAIQISSLKKVIFISSTSVYGDVCREVTEADEPANRSELLQSEMLFLSAKNLKTVVVRFGGLFGPDRNPGRFFRDKNSIPNGLAPVNMIHLQDCLGLIKAILAQPEFPNGCYNAVAPTHSSRKDFYTKAIEKMGLAAPDFADEKTDWKMVNSIKVEPVLHYQFQFPDLLACLDDENAFK